METMGFEKCIWFVLRGKLSRKSEQEIIRIAYLDRIRAGMLRSYQVGRSLDGCLEKTELDPIDKGVEETLKVIKQRRKFEEGKLMLPFLL